MSKKDNSKPPKNESTAITEPDNAAEITDGTATPTESKAHKVTAVPALSQVENANQLISQSVLYNPDKVHFAGTTKPVADQAAAMMIEDTRTFMQGMEQILTMAFAKASAMVLEGNPDGEKAVASFSGLMLNLPVFAERVASAATTITTTFDDGTSNEKLTMVKCEAGKTGDGSGAEAELQDLAIPPS